MTDKKWGPFAHLPEGAFGDAEAKAASAALDAFSRLAMAHAGRIPKAAGKKDSDRAALAVEIAAGFAAAAEAAWRETFEGGPDWTADAFIDGVLDCLGRQLDGAALHFGNRVVKEMIAARVFHDAAGHLSILLVGGRRDALAFRGRGGLLRGSDPAEDRRILAGARPFSDAAKAAGKI